jgi:3-deoxy-D-manno-octulosonic-acid transferase
MLARQRTDIIDHTFYFPIDLPWCVRRCLSRINPEMVIIAETEIWPNFLRACRRRGIQVSMINGRISDRSFARYRIVRHWLRRVFEDYTVMGMQSETDRKRIEAIGADPQRVTVFGNLKYDVASSPKPLDPDLVSFFRNWDQILVAASTTPGEEEFVLDCFAALRQKHPNLKMIIAPRHADRFSAVEEIVKSRGFSCMRRTELGHSGTVLLLDTIGELAAVFAYVTVVFMGGSLVPKGGHNILEPARQRKPIVFGPHMENFRDMTRLFLDADAAIQIQRPSDLAPSIERLLSNPERASQLGRNAYSVAISNTGATERVLKFLQPIEARR